MKHITIYTDGSVQKNPGPGGWAAILFYEGNRKEITGGFSTTTNNRVEMWGAIYGLEALKFECRVSIYSDSQLLVDGMTRGWVERWSQNGWKNSEGKAVANRDLWERLVEICKNHIVTFHWIRGHAGDMENERADLLAKDASLSSRLPKDPGYFPTSPKTMADLVTPKQLVAMRSIANARGFNLDDTCEELFNCGPNAISKSTASEFIERAAKGEFDG